MEMWDNYTNPPIQVPPANIENYTETTINWHFIYFSSRMRKIYHSLPALRHLGWNLTCSQKTCQELWLVSDLVSLSLEVKAVSVIYRDRDHLIFSRFGVGPRWEWKNIMCTSPVCVFRYVDRFHTWGSPGVPLSSELPKHWSCVT